MTFHGKLSPHQVLPMTAARRAWAEKGSCACNHQVKGHTFPPQGTCMTGGHRSYLPSPGRAQWSEVTPSLPRVCTVVTAHTFPPQGVHSGHGSHLPSPGRAQWSQLTPSLPRVCTVVTAHTFPPQGVHSGHGSHLPSPGRAQWSGHTFSPQGVHSGQGSHLLSPARAQWSVHTFPPQGAEWSQITPSLPRVCTGVTGHTFPPQLVHSGHRSHVSPGRMHVECLPAGQEGSCACPVPPPPRARPRSRCNRQAVEQPEIHRAALWPALLSVDLCPPSHSSRES